MTMWGVLALWLAPMAQAETEAPVPSVYGDAAPFLDAIARERREARAAFPVTGITVPHHLLAADLMARGFWAASGNRYDRVILLSPDHFNRSQKPFATTARDHETVLGRIPADRQAVAALLATPDLVEASDLFEREHGVAALLPFVKRFFPDATLVPVAISIRAEPADWDRAVALLAPLLGPRTLVVQSTDYSHYRPQAESILRDQESLNVIASEDADAVTRLVSSDHMDSRGAQYIQMRLQERQGSRATVIANRNSLEYIPHASRTTSYVVSVYSPEIAAFPERYTDQDVLVFGGDVLLGRYLTKPLAEPEVAAEIVRRIRALTGGAPMVVNLEGALLAEPPEGLPDNLHAMPAGLALPILTALNVKAASLANNHSFDLGRDGYRESIDILRRAGIVPLTHGAVADLGPVRLVALNFVGRNDRSGFPAVRSGELEALCRAPARPPFWAFVHWGTEYAEALGPQERDAAAVLARCGIGGIVGAHSHRAAARIEAPIGGGYALAPSLGNLLFDQTATRGTGALLEMRVFRQGTVATRLLPLPNLFDEANALLRARQEAVPDLTPTATRLRSGSAGSR